MPLAFFDLDRTLLSVNAGSLWLQSELRAGRVTPRQAIKGTAYLLGYHLGYARIEEAITQAVKLLANQPESELRERTEAFYRREISSRYRSRSREVLERHRLRGDTLVLLTTSSNYLSNAVQRDLGIHHVLCNRFEVEDGRFTGRLVLPLCYGLGKLEHAKRLADELGEDLRVASFYTDSYSDLSVLEAVGDPVVVHPDPRLLRVAVERHYRIEWWDDHIGRRLAGVATVLQRKFRSA